MTQAQLEADERAHVAYVDWVETHTHASDGNGGFLGNPGRDVAVVADSSSRSKGNPGSPHDGAGSPPDQAPIMDPRA